MFWRQASHTPSSVDKILFVPLPSRPGFGGWSLVKSLSSASLIVKSICQLVTEPDRRRLERGGGMRTLEQERAFCEEGVHEEAEGITFETLGKELGQDTILFSPYLFWVIYFSHSMFLICKNIFHIISQIQICT